MNLLRKISEEVDVVAKLKRDGNASPADVVNVLLHISLLFDGIRLGHGETSALKAMMLWNMAILLEKSRSRGICSLGGADYFDKLNKCLHLSVAHYLNTTGAEMASSTGRTGVLSAAEEEEGFRASASSVQAPGALPSSTTLIHLLSVPSSKTTKKLVDLIIDLLHCPESTEIEDLRLIRREMQFLLASTAPMMTTDRTLLQHALAWWTQDLNMGRYTAMKNEDYQALCLHDDVLRYHVSPVSVGASILDGNAPAMGAEMTMALSIPALTIVHDLYHIWASPSDRCALLFDQDMAFSKDYQPIVDCVGVIQRHLHDARRWHRSLSSAVASCQPTPHWSDEAAKQTFLSGVESVMDHVKASIFQPFVDYYIVKSFLWLCASKVCWFYFDDLLTAEACAKKSFSYAHNRSIRDGPWTRWLRLETLLFSAEVAENLGKTSRAVDNVAEAWQLVTQLRGTSPTEPQVSPTALCIRVVVHVLRHWHRIESARLQELVTSLGVAGFNDEAATSTVAWLMNQYPTFQTKLSAEPTVMSAMQNTPSRPRRPEAFDVDILWQRSAMGWQDPTAAAAKGLNAAMPNEDAMLRFSLQCPFPVARHLRKAAAISLVQGDRGADSVRNLQAFVAGASAAFLTLERSSYLPTPSVPSSGSKVQCDQNPSVQLVQEALRSSSTSIDAVAQRLDLLVAQSSSSTQVAFLTCDVATDTILAGVYRHRGHRDVQVLSIAGGKALHALAHRWRNMLEAQHQQLRRTKDLAIVTQMTEKEKKQWWKQREQMEADIEAILVECETLLSPLLALLRAPVATDSGPSHDGDISEPLSTAEPHKAPPTTTGAISATPSARSGVKKQPLGTGTALKAMTGHGGGGAGGGARGLPLESMASLRHAPVSRMISLPLLLDIIRRRQEAVSNEQEGPWWQPAEAKRTWYALDAENNLPTTRATLWPLLEEAQERWGWSGFVGQVPKPEVAKTQQAQQEIFVSGRLTSRGEHDPMGPVLSYLCHGAPYFVLGNLWDVTDRDLDRLTIEVIRQVFALKTNPSPPPTHATSALVSTKKVLFQDDDDDDDLGPSANSNSNSNSNKNSDAKSQPVSTTDAGVDLGSCLAFARDVCRMRYAVGAAAVVYGIPVPIALQE
eukprot:gene11565-8245_t